MLAFDHLLWNHNRLLMKRSKSGGLGNKFSNNVFIASLPLEEGTSAGGLAGGGATADGIDQRVARVVDRHAGRVSSTIAWSDERNGQWASPPELRAFKASESVRFM